MFELSDLPVPGEEAAGSNGAKNGLICDSDYTYGVEWWTTRMVNVKSKCSYDSKVRRRGRGRIRKSRDATYAAIREGVGFVQNLW